MKFNFRTHLRCFLLTLFGMALAFTGNGCLAQSRYKPVTILHGEVIPDTAAKNTWFENTQTHRVYVYRDKNWVEVAAGEFTEIYACSRWVVLRKTNDLLVSTQGGETVFKNCKGVVCEGVLFGFWTNFYLGFDDGTYTNDLSNINNWESCKDLDIKRLEVQGQGGYCLPGFFVGNSSYKCDELRCWGILGVNGKWLIEPKYDHPFTFVNGVAEVTCKNKPLKINEKGELIQ